MVVLLVAWLVVKLVFFAALYALVVALVAILALGPWVVLAVWAWRRWQRRRLRKLWLRGIISDYGYRV